MYSHSSGCENALLIYNKNLEIHDTSSKEHLSFEFVKLTSLTSFMCYLLMKIMDTIMKNDTIGYLFRYMNVK